MRQPIQSIFARKHEAELAKARAAPGQDGQAPIGPGSRIAAWRLMETFDVDFGISRRVAGGGGPVAGRWRKLVGKLRGRRWRVDLKAKRGERA